MSAPTPLCFQGRGDAYLEWAQFTDYAHFTEIRSSQASPSPIGLLLKWKKGVSPSRDELAKLNIKIPSVYAAHAICAFALSTTEIKHLLGGSAPPLSVECVELATPVVSEQAQTTQVEDLDIQWNGVTTKLLLGVIDHGCSFANTSFIKANGDSRIVALWDQNPRATTLPQSLSKITLAATDYGYGTHWSRHTLNAVLKTACDDDAAYVQLNMPFMRRRVLHGAHVLDVLAGPVPVRSRVSSTRNLIKGPPADGSQRVAPTWQPAGDLASRAPIAFVQLPQAALDDPSGRWLGRQVLDGLYYIAQCAARLKVDRAVVNLSWGPQTGPHDGSSLLEQAMDNLINLQTPYREFAIVLPAGNSYQARAHAQFDVAKGLDRLAWHVPPGSRSPAFLEIWWPAGTDASKIQMTVTAPNAVELMIGNAGMGIVSPVDKSWGITLVPHGDRCMALLALAPTDSQIGAVTAPHGGWKISIAAQSAKAGNVHIYVARANPNLGSKVSSQASYLDDPLYDPKRYLRAAEEDDGSSTVMRSGTLNGIATGRKSWVASGYVMATQKPAKYSSAGEDMPAARWPDWAFPTDESDYLPGILAGGVRSGSVFRLIGTSAAAPQLARRIANQGVKNMTPPAGQTLDASVGAGRLPEFVDI